MCGDCVTTKALLQTLGVPYTEINIKTVSGAIEEMITINGGDRRIPTVVFYDDSFLIEPSDPVLTRRLDELGYI